MNIFNSGIKVDEFSNTPSIFLAGPSDRTKEITKWRNEAVSILKDLGFNGNVYIPEPWARTKEIQINWEIHHLNIAKCILFWVPRDLKELPGFTTNIEFGEWLHSKKMVLGFPLSAERMEYIAYRARQNDVTVFNNLLETLKKAIEIANTTTSTTFNSDFYKLSDKI